MKHAKKLLCLVSAMLMIMAMCVPVSAADTITMEKYTVCGTAYTLPATTDDGATVAWDVASVNTNVPAKRIVTGETTVGTPVELTLNVGMYEPIALENFETKTEGAHLETEADGVWSSYGSTARAGGTYVSEENVSVSNKYMEITETTGNYGAVYSFAEALSGKVVFEYKIKIPEEGKPDTESGSYMRLRLLNSSHTTKTNTSVFANPVPYIEGFMYVEDGAYYYKTVEKDENGTTRNYHSLRLADYNEQWISLRLVVDTTTNTYDLYCGSNKCGNGGYSAYYSNVTEATDDQKCFDVKNIQFRAPGILYLDDVVVYKLDNSQTPVYYKGIEDKTYYYHTGATNAALRVPVSLVTESGTEAADGETLGLICSPLYDTSMPGRFEMQIENYEGAKIIYDIFKPDYSTLYEDFAAYGLATDSSAEVKWTDVGSIVLDGAINKVLELEADGSAAVTTWTTGDSSKPVTDVTYEVGYKIKPMKVTGISSTQYFYAQMSGSNANGPIINTRYSIPAAAGTYTKYKLSSTDVAFPSDVWKTDDWNTVCYKITENNTDLTVNVDYFVNNILVASEEYGVSNLSNANRQPYRWKFYTSNGYVGKIYLDDVYIAKHIGVESVASSATPVTVVKGQALPKAYVTSTLTDGTTNKLPVIYTADTSAAGNTSANGTVYGFDATVTVPVTVLALPYTASVSGDTLTINKPTDYAPGAIIYGASYDGNKLANVELLGEINANTVWTSGSTAVDMTGKNVSKVFIFNGSVQPLSEPASK